MASKVIKGMNDQDLSLVEELAYLYCTHIGGELSQWIDARRGQLNRLQDRAHRLKTMCIGSGIIGVIGLIVAGASGRNENLLFLGLAATAVCAVALIVFLVISNQVQKTHAAVERSQPALFPGAYELLAWEGEVVPAGETAMLIDRTGIFPRQKLEFNTLKPGWERPTAVMKQLNRMLNQPPVLSPNTDQLIDQEYRIGEYEKQILQIMKELKAMLTTVEQQSVDVNIVPPGNDLAKLVATDQARREWLDSREQISSDVQDLHTLYSESTRAAAAGEIDNEKALASLDTACSEGVSSLKSIRDESIVNHLDETLRQLEDSYFLPMVRLCCPDCYQQATDELDEDEHRYNVTVAMTDSIDPAGDDTMKRALHERDRKFKVSTMKFDIELGEQGMFYCEQCGKRADSEMVKKHMVLRVKEDLVYPLWDRLWDEVATERHRILREKEQQLLENRSREHDELNRAQAEFADEKRSIRNRLDDIEETCRKTEKSIEGLIDALFAMDLIDENIAEDYRTITATDKNAISSDISQLRSLMHDLENEMEEMADQEFNNRGLILDEVDQVKRRGRFFTVRRERDSELSISN